MTTNHPIWGPFERGTLWADVGDMGTGKTYNELAAFPNAYLLGDPGGWSGPSGPRGLNIPIDTRTIDQGGQVGFCQTVEEAVAWIDWIAAAYAQWPVEQRPRHAVIINDLSLLFYNSQRYWWETISPGGDGTFLRWEKLKNAAVALDLALQRAGLHCAASMQEAEPKTKDGNLRRGGADTPGPSVTKIVARRWHAFGLVRRDQGMFPWPVAYHNPIGPDPQRDIKDRLSVLTGRQPLNMRELLRHAGYPMPRLAGLEWQDDLAEHVAVAVEGGEKPRDVFKRFFSHYAASGDGKLVDQHVWWALCDGVARAHIRDTGNGHFAQLMSRKPGVGAGVGPGAVPAGPAGPGAPAAPASPASTIPASPGAPAAPAAPNAPSTPAAPAASPGAPAPSTPGVPTPSTPKGPSAPPVNPGV